MQDRTLIIAVLGILFTGCSGSDVEEVLEDPDAGWFTPVDTGATEGRHMCSGDYDEDCVYGNDLDVDYYHAKCSTPCFVSHTWVNDREDGFYTTISFWFHIAAVPPRHLLDTSGTIRILIPKMVSYLTIYEDQGYCDPSVDTPCSELTAHYGDHQSVKLKIGMNQVVILNARGVETVSINGRVISETVHSTPAYMSEVSTGIHWHSIARGLSIDLYDIVIAKRYLPNISGHYIPEAY